MTTTIEITCLNGYCFKLLLRNTSISNIKTRIYEHFKSIEHEQYKQYLPKYQCLIFNDKELTDDVALKNGDVLTVIIITDKDLKTNRLLNRMEKLNKLFGQL